MKVIIQRVLSASVTIDKHVTSIINQGFLIFLGIEKDDVKKDLDYILNKTVGLRIFNDNNNNMNLSIRDVDGEALVVSQFTLHAKIKKGNRPSYIKAARPEQAIPLYEQFKKDMSDVIGKEVQSGEFAAYMNVTLTNNGPVTIIIDTKNKE